MSPLQYSVQGREDSGYLVSQDPAPGHPPAAPQDHMRYLLKYKFTVPSLGRLRSTLGILKHSDDSDVIATQLATTCGGKNKKFIQDWGLSPGSATSWL